MIKKVKGKVFSIIFILVIVLCVCAAALAADTTGSYKLDGQIFNALGTYDYGDSNIIVIKQSTSAFIWVDDTITDDNDTIKSVIGKDYNQDKDYLDPSVDPANSYVTTSTSFKLYDFIAGNQYNYQIEINTANKTVTVSKINSPDPATCCHDEGVSHIDLISYEPPVDPEYGSLKVTKDVTGDDASTTEEFAITVAFSGDNLSGIQCSGGTWNDDTDTYDLSLADGEFATFTNIPLETSYTITETLTGDQEDAGWEGPADDLEGEINDETTDVEETVENTYDPGTPPGDPEYGSLKVTKNVTGDNASSTEEFAITVQFSGTTDNLNDIEFSGGTTSPNGTYILSLCDDEFAEFTNIPMGIGYTITENLTPAQTSAGWEGPVNEANDLNGTINSTAEVEETVENTYDPGTPPGDPEYGSLKVTKNVTGDNASSTEEFAITVQFSGTTDNLNDIEFSGGTTSPNGTYILSLCDDEFAEFTNIPMGIGYTITENLTPAQTSAGWEGPVNEANDLNGTINSTTEVDKTVENTYDPGTPPGDPEYGSLKVTKDVLTTGAPDADFAITVQFNIGENGSGSLEDIDFSGGDTDSNGTYTLSLSDAEFATFTNIPLGTTYTVIEKLTSTQISKGWFRASSDASGTISDSQQNDIIVKNKYDKDTPSDPDEYGSLIVTKNVTGDGASTIEKFDITVQFTGSDLSGIKCNGGTLSDGKYTLSLANGESATFTKIPLGAEYTVTETLTDDQKDAGWTGPDSSSTGKITGTSRVGVVIENIFEESGVLGDIDVDNGDQPVVQPEEESGVLGDIDVLPDTGGMATATIIGILGIVLIASALLLNSKAKRKSK